MLHTPWAKGTKLQGGKASLLKVSSFPAAPLPPWLSQCHVEPLPSGTSGCSQGCCSAVEISISERLPEQSQAGSCFPGTQVSALFLSQPRGFILQKTMFLGAFDAGTVLAQSLRSFF